MKNPSSGINDFFENVHKRAMDDVIEHLAQGVATTARENGLESADEIEIEIDLDTSEPGWQIDPERVRHRANEILASG